MSKDESPSSIDANELLSRLFDCNNHGRKAIGKVDLDGKPLSGTINSLDRAGENRIAIAKWNIFNKLTLCQLISINAAKQPIC